MYSVSYLGPLYSFHHIAALHYFKEAHLIACNAFDEIIQNVLSEKTFFGIIAIDNSVAGRVGENLEKIIDNDLSIFGEIELKIQLHLAACENVHIQDIRIVYSQRMALKECSRFFAEHPALKQIEYKSTAGAIKKVAAEKLKNAAAIGNKTAIEKYGLHLIAKDIDDNPDNFTRFFIISSQKNNPLQTTAYPKKASFVLKSSDKNLTFNSLIAQTGSKAKLSYMLSAQPEILYEEVELDNSATENLFFSKTKRIIKVLGVYEPAKKIVNV